MSGDLFQPVYDLYVGCREGVTWGTPVDCDLAAARLPCLSESFAFGVEHYQNKAFMGSIFESQARAGKLGPVTGGIKMHLDPDNGALPLVHIFGAQSVPAQQSGTAGYLSTLSWAPNVRGLFSTVALEKGIDLEEIASFKWTGFDIEGASGEGVVVTFSGIGDYQGWDGSTPFPATTVALPGSNLTFKAVDPLPFFNWNEADFEIWINASSGAALDNTVRIRPDAFKLTAERPMRTFHTRAPYIAEPADNGFVPMTGSFNLPLWQAITYQEARLSNTPMKMQIRMRGPLISGSIYYRLDITLPAIEITEAPANADGEETVAHPVSFRAVRYPSTPTGLASAEPYATIINKYTAALI